MILFLEDWKQYPTAIVDLNTSNKSWLYMASLLKTMGIKNHYFHLSLMQPELQGIDPYSKNLSDDIKIKIQLECEYNPWYFFREIYYVSDGNLKRRFEVNRGNLSLLWSFFNGIDYALEMIRQTGKSVTCDGLELYLTHFYYRNTEILLIIQNRSLRKTTVSRIKKHRNLLPNWLNPNVKQDSDNTENITCVLRNNILKTEVGQTQEEVATRVGRGGTFPYIHFEETAFTPNINISMPGAIAAGTAKRENCEENHILYGNVFTTTAGKLDSEEGKYCHSFFTSGTYWNEKFFDCINKKDLKEIITTNAGEPGRCLLYGVFNHRQLSKSDEWLRNRIIQAKATIEQIARDWFNRWTSGQINGAIDANLLEIINKFLIDPIHVNISKEKYIMRWYINEYELEERLNTSHYIIGLDTSELIGKDANGLIITDIRDMSVIGVCRVSESSLLKYGVWLGNFMVKYLNTTLVIEKKSSAQGIIDTIISILINNRIDPFKRIYNKIVDNSNDYKEEFLEIAKPISLRKPNIYDSYKKYFGFITSKSSRLFLYNTVFNDMINSSGHLLKDSMLINELNGLIEKNGRIDHVENGHDDLVIALLLCHWFVKHTKNLQFYGINLKDCLSLVSSDGATLTEEDIEIRKKLTLVTNEINDLKTKLTSSFSIVESARLERLMEFKIKEANDLGDTALSLDKILSEIYSNKASKRSLRESLNRVKSQQIYR